MPKKLSLSYTNRLSDYLTYQFTPRSLEELTLIKISKDQTLNTEYLKSPISSTTLGRSYWTPFLLKHSLPDVNIVQTYLQEKHHLSITETEQYQAAYLEDTEEPTTPQTLQDKQQPTTKECDKRNMTLYEGFFQYSVFNSRIDSPHNHWQVTNEKGQPIQDIELKNVYATLRIALFPEYVYQDYQHRKTEFTPMEAAYNAVKKDLTALQNDGYTLLPKEKKDLKRATEALEKAQERIDKERKNYLAYCSGEGEIVLTTAKIRKAPQEFLNAVVSPTDMKRIRQDAIKKLLSLRPAPLKTGQVFLIPPDVSEVDEQAASVMPTSIMST